MTEKMQSVVNYILAFYNGTIRETYNLVDNYDIENNDYEDDIEKNSI